jgi:site-specific DNA-methyltransferase (adenine-specific)
MKKDEGKDVLFNKIYHGDCAVALSQIADDSVNLIVTSPPYADKRKNSYGGTHSDKYVEWFMPIATQLYRVLKNDGSFVLNIKEHPTNGERETYVLELILEMKRQGWRWVEEYCWYKKNSFPGKWTNRFRDSWERCLHFTKSTDFKMYQDEVTVPIGDWAQKRFKSMTENDFVRYISKNNTHLGRNVSNWLNRKKVYPHNVLVFEEEHRLYLSNVIENAVDGTSKNHSAIFPIELPSWFIKVFSKVDDVILDPFLGSGTTAVAAVLHNRNYIGVEIIKDYFEEAEKNINEAVELMQGNKRKKNKYLKRSSEQTT